MSLKTRKRIKTRVGLFLRALKRGSELGPGEPLFMSLKIRKRIKILTVNNQKQIFLGLVGFYF